MELTTHPGLEDVVVDELQAALGAPVDATLRADGMAGHVRVAFAGQGLTDAVAGLRTIHRWIRPVAQWAWPEVDPLGDLRARVSAAVADVPELADDGACFRVRCHRVGEHPFGSEDVERVAGAGVRDHRLLPVRLRGPAVVVRCDVRGPEVRLGVERGGVARPTWPWRQATSLKPQLAAGLLALGRPFGAEPPAAVGDPFCGGGTLLLEAAARWPAARLLGGDRSAAAAEGVAANLAALGASARASVAEGDARALAWPEKVDLLVMNPPFGDRLGRELDLEAFYRSVLGAALDVTTPDARAVVLARRRGAFNRALRGSGWATRHVRIVELGGQYAGAFVLGRR